MPYGSWNAPQTFQSFKDQVLRGLNSVFVCIDNFLIASKDKHGHLQYLRSVFERSQEYDFPTTASSAYLVLHLSNSLGITLTVKIFYG